MIHRFTLLSIQFSFHITANDIDLTLWNIEKFSKHGQEESWFARANLSNYAYELSFLDLKVNVFKSDDVI